MLLAGCMDFFGSQNQATGSSGVIPQYFWGSWVRMDGTNDQWYFSDASVRVADQPRTFQVRSDEEVVVAGERVERRTDNMVAVVPAAGLEYFLFRRSGANAEVSGGVRGDQQAGASVLSASTIGGIGGINTVLRNVGNSRNSAEVITDAEGNLVFNEVIPGDRYTLTVPAQPGVSRPVTVTVTPEFDGERIGLVTLTDAEQNFRVEYEIESGDPWGDLYADRSYWLQIRIINIGEEDMLSADYEVGQPDGLSISGDDLENILGTVQRNGGYQELSYAIRADQFTEDFRDIVIPVRVVSHAMQREWRDEISLRFNRETMSIHVRSHAAEVQGVVISPDRRSFPFRTSGRQGSITVPARDSGYILALSGAGYTSETRYAVAINAPPATNGAELTTTTINEPDNDETQATPAGTGVNYLGYLGVRDLDFFAIYNRRVTLPESVEWTGLAPTDDFVVATRNPVFQWDEIAGVATYHLQIVPAGDSFTGAPVLEAMAPGYVPAEPLVDGAFQWRIRGEDAFGNTTVWSEPGHFQVIWGTFAEVLPADDALVPDIRPTIWWEPVSEAISYEIVVADSESGVETAVVHNVTESHYQVPSDLEVGEERFWRVRALGDSREGPWSAVRSFTVSASAFDFNGGVIPPGFSFGGNVGWSAVSSPRFVASHSLQAGWISWGRTSSVVYSNVVPAGRTLERVSFRVKTDTMDRYTTLNFYLNGELRGPGLGWYGTIDWTLGGASFTPPLEAGQPFSLRWTFSHNNFGSWNGAWIDDIVLVFD